MNNSTHPILPEIPLAKVNEFSYARFILLVIILSLFVGMPILYLFFTCIIPILKFLYFKMFRKCKGKNKNKCNTCITSGECECITVTKGTQIYQKKCKMQSNIITNL